MARHSDLLANRSHEPAFHQTSDPFGLADNRVTAGKFWVDITIPAAPILYIRNEANSAWVVVSSGSTFTDTTFAINDSVDATKQIKFDAAGTTGTSTTIQGSQTTNKTLTLPDVTSTVLARTSTDQGANRVQNKDLDASNTKIVDNTDTTKKIAFTASGNTTAVTGTIAAVFTTAKTLTLPDATDTLVAKATTDILTNKTITSTTNNVAAKSLLSATTTIDVFAAAAPTSGQVLTATSGTAATWQTPGGGGGGMSIYKQTTGGGTTFGDSSVITTPLMALGRVTIPASTTQTVTVNKGGSAASNIYSVMLTTKGNWSNLVYLEDVAGNVFPKVGSTFTINNNDSVSHDVYVMSIID